MGIKNVTINGEEYPFKLNMKALLNFQKNTGLKLEDLGNIINDSDNLEALLHEGLKEGARKKGHFVKIEKEDVLDCTIPEFTKLMAAVMESIEGPKTTAKKKKLSVME